MLRRHASWMDGDNCCKKHIKALISLFVAEGLQQTCLTHTHSPDKGTATSPAKVVLSIYATVFMLGCGTLHNLHCAK